MSGCFRSRMFLDCILIWLCSLHLGTEAGRCPRNVMREAKRCMRHIHAYNRHETLLNMLLPGTDGTKQLCRDGKIQTAFTCLNKLYSSCAKSKQGMRHLEMMVDVGKWRNAIDNICNSMPYIENFAECEAKAKVEYEPCAQEAKIEFVQKINFLESEVANWPPAQKSMATKQQVDIACTFTTDIMNCLQHPFERHCPRRMALILRKTFEDFIPPACAKRAQRSVIYTVGKQKPGIGGSHHGEYPDVVDIVKQGDGNSNNNNNDNINNGGGYGVSGKGDVKPVDKNVKTVDEENVNVNDNGNNGKGKGGNKLTDSPANVGNVAEVRGSNSGGDGDGDEDGLKDDNNGTAPIGAGSGSTLLSIAVALVMMKMKNLVL